MTQAPYGTTSRRPPFTTTSSGPAPGRRPAGRALFPVTARSVGDAVCSAGGSRRCNTGTTSAADSSPDRASPSTDRADPETPKSVPAGVPAPAQHRGPPARRPGSGVVGGGAGDVVEAGHWRWVGRGSGGGFRSEGLIEGGVQRDDVVQADDVQEVQHARGGVGQTR